MCGFKPGDEVVCVIQGEWMTPARGWRRLFSAWKKNDGPRNGDASVITDVCMKWCEPLGRELPMLRISTCGWRWFGAANFRKVQSRDLTAWLETASTFEEPKRKKARA